MLHTSRWLIGMSSAALIVAGLGAAAAQSPKPDTTSPAASPAAPGGSPSAGSGARMQGRFAAPVGHRQPTRADVPDTDRAQTRAGTGFDDLDSKLRICRGC